MRTDYLVLKVMGVLQGELKATSTNTVMRKMKKANLTALLTFAVLFLLVSGVQVVEVATANFVPQASINFISSPTNTTYSSNFLTLNFTVSFAMTNDRWIAYSIDGNENVTVTGVDYQIDALWHGINITEPLPKLSDGSHRLDISAQSVPTSYASPDKRTIFFTIDTASPTLAPSPTPSATPTLIQSPLPSSTPSLSPSPSIPEFPAWSVLVFVVAVSAFLVALKKKVGANLKIKP